jgi:hypothetical protein
MAGSNMSPTFPDVSGRVMANAQKNTQPTQSAAVRLAGAEAVIAAALNEQIRLRGPRGYCTSAIEPVVGPGVALNAPVVAIDVKYPNT